MSDSLPWMKFYPRETLSDSSYSGWSLEERGAWWHLILHNWIEGSIPSDQGSLGRLLRVDDRVMRGLWSAIGSKFIPHPDVPGRLTSPRLEVEREKAVGVYKKRSAAGVKAATARWQREKERHAKRMRSVSTTHPDRMPDVLDPATDPDPATDSASSLPAKERLAGESVGLRSFREGLTQALTLPDMVLIAQRQHEAEVIAFFEEQLKAVGPEQLLKDCMEAAAKKKTADMPASLAWFVPWLKRLSLPAKGYKS
jgi:uncharacterized protein YdaU (DUF1376 family)